MMAYSPTIWRDGDVITADKLNKLEQGVQNEQEGPPGPSGADGAQGPAGADATINGVNALTVIAKDGLIGSMSGDTYTISGTGVQSQIKTASNLAFKAVCPNNEILLDNADQPSVMVYIPKMTYAQLGLGNRTEVHPAFIVNNQEVDGIYISKYQNVVQNGRAYSLPGQDPIMGITFDQSVEYCTAKGEGWHLMTRAEWALIALWCKNNGFLPWGNNNFGKDTRETNYKAIPTARYGPNSDQPEGTISRVATGTGPLKWSHDGTPSGIWDLNGNVWEWGGGLRTVYGELQVLVNNNAADSSHSQAAAGTEWMAIDGVTGEYVTPNGSGTTANTLKLDYVSNAYKWVAGTISSLSDSSRGCTFEAVTVDSSVGADATLKLQALGLYKYDTTAGAYESDYFHWNNGNAERSLLCGGGWTYGVSAGVFFPNGAYGRAYSGSTVGFRSAFVKLPTA